MKNIFGISIAIIGIVLIGLLSGIFVNVNLEIEAARQFHSATIERIQSSYYSDYVIEECKTKAKSAGYDLLINNTAIYEDINEYYVALNYHVKVPLLNTSVKGIIEGYAR